VLGNGSCQIDTSNSITITVHPSTIAGFVSTNGPGCKSNNQIKIELNAARGTVSHWELSKNGYNNWTTLKDTSSSISLKNLDTSTYVRARVQNYSCPAAYSPPTKVEINLPPLGGGYDSPSAVCAENNYGLLKLRNYRGSIASWEISEDTLGAWRPVSNSQNFIDYNNLIKTTYYRAIVDVQGCDSDTSRIGTVVLDEPSLGGWIDGGKDFCDTINSLELLSRNRKGALMSWQSSNNKGETWSSLHNKSDTLRVINLSESTHFRVGVKNGVCPQTWSKLLLVNVHGKSSAGRISAERNELCSGVNFTTLSLENHLGDNIIWQKKEASNAQWLLAPSNSPLLFANNLKQNTQFRAIVQSKDCPADTSNSISILVHRPIVTGQIQSDKDTICAGGIIQLQLNNYEGEIVSWEKREPDAVWVTLDLETDNILTDTLNNTTSYRVLLKSGNCFTSYSSPKNIVVLAKPSAGRTNFIDTVCSITNQGQIHAIGVLANSIIWQKKTGTAGIWEGANGSANLLTYSGLTQTTAYRLIANSDCGTDTNYLANIHVLANPNVAFSTSGLCSGNQSVFINRSSSDSGTIKSQTWLLDGRIVGSRDSLERIFYSEGERNIRLETANSLGCTSMLDRVVTIHPTPEVSFSIRGVLGNSISCTGQALQCANFTRNNASDQIDYVWLLNGRQISRNEAPKIVVNQAGTHQVTLHSTSSLGCSDSAIRFVKILQSPKVEAFGDTVVSKGVPFNLEAKGAQIFSWEPRVLFQTPENPKTSCKLNRSDSIFLKGVDYQGCTGNDTLLVRVTDGFVIRPSPVITTNNNGYNDTWLIENIENYPDHEILVFNRWGQEVFRSTKYENNWAATDPQGKELTDGTYYYVINLSKGQKVYKGAITVIQK
jgi:gliding motility-associated-like protein